MPDPIDILTTIDVLADLAADVQATRGWIARVQLGHQLDDRERAAVSRHFARLRDNSAAALFGVRQLGLGPDDSQGVAGDSQGGV